MNYLDREGIIERHTGRLVVRDIERPATMVEKVRGGA